MLIKNPLKRLITLHAQISLNHRAYVISVTGVNVTDVVYVMKKKKVKNIKGGMMSKNANMFGFFQKFAQVLRIVAIIALIVWVALSFCGCSTPYERREKCLRREEYKEAHKAVFFSDSSDGCPSYNNDYVPVFWPPDMVPHPHIPEPKPRDPRIPVA